MSLLQNSNAISTGGGYNLESSLRFRSSASAYLNRTPASAGNLRKWTFSVWLKLSDISSNRQLFSGGSATSDQIWFSSVSKKFDVYINGTSRFTTDAVFRDPSAWYHIIVVYDSDNATASNRIIVYVNGVQQTNTASAIPQNTNSKINTASGHTIGSYAASALEYIDGYITEVNFVDGQALTPSDFGEYDDTTGVWKPKEYTGTYGTNGFYLPMKETQQATGFNTVLYTGSGGTQSISNVGFSPDLVWVKDRDAALFHLLTDSVRGVSNTLSTNGSNAESFATEDVLSSFDADGFTLAADDGSGYYGWNRAGISHVAWCWDAGSSTVSNTDGTITSSVRANPATGFSVVTWTGNGTAGATIGHGLGAVPKMIIAKSRTNGSDWWDTYHESLGNSNAVFLNSTYESVARTYWNNTTPTSSVITLGSDRSINGSGETFVAYCFSEVAGYSKIGSYTGTGASGNTVTTGFRPAFILVKRTDVSGNDWILLDATRDASNPRNTYLLASQSFAEGDGGTALTYDFNDTGFTVNGTGGGNNASGGTYIYMAFADTRDAQFNFDASGNKNNWTANNINSNASSETTYDIMNDVATLTDEDTANFATLNPVNVSGGSSTITDGNLSCSAGSVTTYGKILGSIGISTGKWYWETTITAVGSIANVGLSNGSLPSGSYGLGGASGEVAYQSNGNKYVSGTATAYGSSYTTNDIIGGAYDADAGSITFYKNNVSQGAITGFSGIKFPAVGSGGGTNPQYALNFGQRPFKYTPPTGFKKLNTYNLPDSTIKDGSQYFDTVTWTGNGGTQDISLEFSPDLVWAKDRSAVAIHMLSNTISGPLKSLSSNDTTAEASNDAIRSFNSNGFTTGTWVNTSSNAFVGWSWRGSDSSPVSNTDGTITSTVSANTTSGFSVVTYTGNNTSGSTVGHGLGVAPSMVICKNRTTGIGSGSWATWHTGLSGGNYYLFLNSTAAQASGNNNFTAAPTSTVLNLGTSDTNNTADMVAYCFADVEGFSKFGSYTGNGSTDGPFVYTGFRPAFVLVKRTDGVQNWTMYDSARDTDNVVQNLLVPNTSGAEATYAIYDFLSNGFKLRNTDTAFNGSGANYIYMAFAENPFKQSLAR